VKKKILLVDDDKNIRDLYEFLLEKAGEFIIRHATDGHEAFRIFDEFHPDLILLDVMMPRLDGLQVLKKLRQSNPDVIIVINTAHADVKKNMISWTAHAIIEKTMLPGEVIATIKRLLSEADDQK